MTSLQQTRDDVSEYYGETLQSSDDLKTSACCPIDAMPEFMKPLLAKVHPEVSARFYGCGSPIPPALEGKTVLDLGCGTGRDCYVLSQLVGETGKVIGVDMTEAQLAVAKRHQQWHVDQFGQTASNIEFHHGYIEDLATLGLEDNSIDVVVSNCVINLSADKEKVFSEIFRVLKPGGELYFSDVFSDRRLSPEQQQDKTMLGECLGGAMYIEDFRRMLLRLGVYDYRTMSQGLIALHDDAIVKMARNVSFFSATVRAFKIEVEDRCEDYGQTATYLGGITHQEMAFRLDDHHLFEIDRTVLVCENTAKMLASSRFGRYFIVSEPVRHFGIFECSSTPPGDESSFSCC